MPHLYLDELWDMLVANPGICVSRSIIWCTLQAGGFTMKKVQVKYSIDNIGTDLVGSSFHALQLSVWKKSNLHTSTKSVYTQWNSLFSLTRALWIVKQHIEGQLGLFMVCRHNIKLSLFVADGKSLSFFLIHSVDSVS